MRCDCSLLVPLRKTPNRIRACTPHLAGEKSGSESTTAEEAPKEDDDFSRSIVDGLGAVIAHSCYPRERRRTAPARCDCSLSLPLKKTLNRIRAYTSRLAGEKSDSESTTAEEAPKEDDDFSRSIVDGLGHYVEVLRGGRWRCVRIR